MTDRPEHAPLRALLSTVDAALCHDTDCWLGGGTAVSLRCDGFRLSRDVDFLCASRDGYARLRERVWQHDAQGLFTRPVTVVRPLRVDRYGIRVVVGVEATAIKLEIVSEGRIDLRGVDDPALPVPRLSDADLVAEKLLANEDRYADDATLSRDILDLILLEHTLGALPESAWIKARSAYGPSVDTAYTRALHRLRDRPDHLLRTLDGLSITAPARAVIAARLAQLPPSTDDRR